jgi:HrpA-like RNA helicase
LKLRGINVAKFDWMDRPSDANLKSATQELLLVGAIDERDEVTMIGELAVKLGSPTSTNVTSIIAPVSAIFTR